MEVVFMGTPEFAVPSLDELYNKGYNIKLVITQPDRPSGRGKKLKKSAVKIRAEELGLNIYQPNKIKSEEAVNLINEINPDVIIVIAFGQILSKDILDAPKYGCINVHASLLPELRGAAPINWAIINGLKKTGITTMFMNQGLDTGDILLQDEIPITKCLTAGELHDILMIKGAKLLNDTLERIKKNDLQQIKQNNDEATYAPIINKKMGLINWNDKAENVHNKIRGMYPWPGAYFKHDDKSIKVFNSDYYLDKTQKQPGVVIKVNTEGIYICTVDGVVVIKEIQFPGKKRMTVKNFLIGNTFKENIILE